MGDTSIPSFDVRNIADICRRHGIRELSIFGSAVGGPFTPESDIDLLYEFLPGTMVGFGIVRIEDELSAAFGGRKVDLVPKRHLNRHLRDRVLASARVLYAEG